MNSYVGMTLRTNFSVRIQDDETPVV
eukprot:COSAG02_NODE_36791_length_450_cov_1.031339_1_plen_25_part_01